METFSRLSILACVLVRLCGECWLISLVRHFPSSGNLSDSGTGRRWAFNGTVLISCIFGLCLGAPNTYNAILVLAAFNGFGIGGNIPIDTTICLEFLPQVWILVFWHIHSSAYIGIESTLLTGRAFTFPATWCCGL